MKNAVAGAATIGALLLVALAAHPLPSVRAADASTCTAISGMKPLIRGLVDRNKTPPAANLQGSAIVVYWSDLEPLGPGLVAGNAIDTAIAAAGCSTGLRLRVLAGVHAPEWVKQASGGDISVTNPFDLTTGTVGHFWTDAFRQAYNNLESELAAAYDSVPNLDEVVVSRCTLFYAEPLLRYAYVKSNVANLLAAGYTLDADKQCQLQEIDDTLSRWSTTRVAVAFNPYQAINSDGTTTVDEGYTEQVMGYCRHAAGPRCVLENDSIRDPISTLIPEYVPMYAAMSGASGPIHVTVGGLDVEQALGAPLAFQTAVEALIGDFWGTLVWARQRHAASVELAVDGSYPTSGGSGAPSWQTIAEVAAWFQEDPAISATPGAAVEGNATTGMQPASLSLDELAALDTVGGYGDVGAVPFDTVTAMVTWPDSFAESALLTAGGTPATSLTCPQVRWCAVTIESGGHALAEEAPALPAAVDVSLSTGWIYVPADGVAIAANPPVSVSDAALALVKMRAANTLTAGKIKMAIVFTDVDPGGLASDYTVTVSWGDGSTSVLTASLATLGFKATATHVYAKAGTYKVEAVAADAGGSTLLAHRWVTVA